jgi:hypothetical protein
MNARPASMGPGRIWVLKSSPAKVCRTRLDSGPLPGTVHPPRPVGAPHPGICLCSPSPPDYPPHGEPGSLRPRLHGALMAVGHAAGLLHPIITNSQHLLFGPKNAMIKRTSSVESRILKGPAQVNGAAVIFSRTRAMDSQRGAAAGAGGMGGLPVGRRAALCLPRHEPAPGGALDSYEGGCR